MAGGTQSDKSSHRIFIELSEFARRLAGTARDHRALLRNLFKAVMLAEDTKRSIRLHVLKSDHNGRPQVNLMVSHICDVVIDYCLPRKQVQQAIDHFHQTSSTQRISALKTEAKKLFTDISNSGEGGELLLFILTESVLGYPQVLSKMSLKTSSRMHVHGLDGIYVSCTGSPALLRLHFGESKLHKDPAKSVREATSSIASMLSDEGFLKSARRDYYLLNSYGDLGSQDLENALRAFLDPLDSRYLAPEVCAVLLAGHELENYPRVVDVESLPTELIDKTGKLVNVLEESAKSKGVDSFHIDLFIVPFPNLQAFRDQLTKELSLQ